MIPYTRGELPFVGAAQVFATSGQLTSATFESNGQVGVRVDIDITAASITSLVFTLEYYDKGKGGWLTLLASAALSTTGHTTLHVHPAMTTASNTILAAILPARLRVKTSGTWTSFTGSVSMTYSNC